MYHRVVLFVSIHRFIARLFRLLQDIIGHCYRLSVVHVPKALIVSTIHRPSERKPISRPVPASGETLDHRRHRFTNVLWDVLHVRKATEEDAKKDIQDHFAESAVPDTI